MDLTAAVSGSLGFSPRAHLIVRCICTTNCHYFSPPLRWQVEAISFCIDYFLDYGWHGCVAPRLALVDAFAGADGFGGSDVDGCRRRGHPLMWAVGNDLREFFDDLFMFKLLILIEF